MATASDKFIVVGRGIDPETPMHLILAYAAQYIEITGKRRYSREMEAH